MQCYVERDAEKICTLLVIMVTAFRALTLNKILQSTCKSIHLLF